jgi:hypothetical protein
MPAIRLGFFTLDSNWLLSNVVIPIALILVAWLVIGDLARDPDSLPGIDTYWHVTLIDEAMDRVRSGEPVGPISETINAGRPYLYDTGTSYPQFVYWVSLPVALITGSAAVAYGLLMVTAIAVAQLSFYFGFRSRLGIIAAVVGAAAFAYAPFSLTAVAPEGRYPALLAVSTLPAILAGIISLLDRPSRVVWAITVLAVVLSSAFHAMIFYIGVIPIGFISFLYALNLRVGPKRYVFATSVIVIGVLVAWIALPDGIADLSSDGGLAGISVADTVGEGRAEAGLGNEIVPFSIRWNSFDTSQRLTNLNYAGVGMVLAMLLTVALARRRQVFIFAAGAILAYLLTTGTLTPLWDQLPLKTSLEPRRFLFPAYLAASLVIATGVSHWVRQIDSARSVKALALYGVPIVAVIGLILFDAIPMAKRIVPFPDRQRNEWTEAVNNADVDGRLFWNAGSGFATYYFGGRKTGIEVLGRSSRVDADSRSGWADSALNELALFNTRAVMTDEVTFPSLAVGLLEHGFVEERRWDSRVLLASPASSSLVMNQTVDVGLIGPAAINYWSKILTNTGNIVNPENISEELLSSFRLVVISAPRFSDVDPNEQVLLKYVNNGGRVIVEEPNLAGLGLFKTGFTTEDVPPEFEMPADDGPIDVLPFVAVDGGTFRGVSYQPVGELVLAGTTPEGETVPLIQKEARGEGFIYWVCCNIGNHVDGTGDKKMAAAIRHFFDEEIGGFRSIWPTEFDTEVERLGPSEYRFSYMAVEDTPVLISLGAGAYRSIELEDGQKVKLESVGRIMAAILPAGDHTVTIGTIGTPVSAPVALVWLVGLTMAGLILSVGWEPLGRPGGSYVDIASRAVSAAVDTVVRYFNPIWAGELRFDGGILRADTPLIKTQFEAVSSARDSLERYAPDSPSVALAVVIVEISAHEGGEVDFLIEDLVLHTATGASIKPTKMEGMGTDASPQYILTTAFGRPRTRLEGIVVVGKGESRIGYVLFELEELSDIRSLSIASVEDLKITFDSATVSHV